MEFIDTLVMGKPAWMWAIFMTIVVILLAVDLGLFHRKAREIGVRESLLLSAFYITIGLAFGVWVWINIGPTSGKEYLTGFLVEKTLSMDNIFVMSLIFTYFGIPRIYQHRVLFYGILGVILLRGIVIALGAWLVASFHWVLYIFALLLIFTGIKMLLPGDDEPDIEDNFALRIMRRFLRITPKLHGQRFFIRQPDDKTGKILTWVTPLFVAMILIEIVDVIFALDSIPAIFAITTDTFVVYTSNIFAILGLRALYFALAAVIDRFAYLKPALAMILVFIGSKIFVADLAGWEKFPSSVSLSVTVALIAGGILYSLWRTQRDDEPPSTNDKVHNAKPGDV
ncbi:TerC family protein [Methyloceanibacter caenitepidi]|uniref:Integral membrane protein TerC n=1 Tax=Methyloceanibacter caenitepidi TaxID=1384459 RepID=A0A0A8K4V4_9HYPH|nr:TerC family protein [Methyloceanibacter caenitepidi]BAQ17963.1 integral membrane protein TerC [Methyloceanibacter caenitepidi]